MYIYICISVYVRRLSSFFSRGGVDRPPNARVLRTDIRTIKELLMVRIWSRWTADSHRRSQPVPIFYPPFPPPIPTPSDSSSTIARDHFLSLSLSLPLRWLPRDQSISISRSSRASSSPPSLIDRCSRVADVDFRMGIDRSQSHQSVGTFELIFRAAGLSTREKNGVEKNPFVEKARYSRRALQRYVSRVLSSAVASFREAARFRQESVTSRRRILDQVHPVKRTRGSQGFYRDWETRFSAEMEEICCCRSNTEA